MIPSWRKRKAAERKDRTYRTTHDIESYAEAKAQRREELFSWYSVPARVYCSTCGHRYGTVGHEFSCGS